jgi:polysaccharide export outer membrane protein
MNLMSFIRKISIIAAGAMALALGADGQTTVMTGNDAPPSDARPLSKHAKPSDKPEKDGADDVLTYYDSYLKEYRLGPGDIISVEVFGQCPDYCRTGIIIPPNARISYPLVKEGLVVAGLTVEQVAAEITKKLDEYIIDPSVTVALNRAGSARYSVMGNVAAPAVRIMDRKISVYDAITNSGGVTRNGDRNKIVIVSHTKDGNLSKRTVSLAQMESGKAEMVYLSPGDQVFVSGKGFTFTKFLMVIGRATSAAALFGSGFGLPSVPFSIPSEIPFNVPSVP